MRKIRIFDFICALLPSFLRIFIYRIRGFKIGKRAKISIFSLVSADKIEIGDGSTIMPFTFIKVNSLKIGKRSKIRPFTVVDTVEFSLGDDSTIMEQVLIGGMATPRSKLQIGSRVKIFPFCFLNPTETLTIEDDVGIGGASYIFTHGSWQSQLDGFPVAFAPVTIRKGTWFPWRVFVMPGVEVGEYSTIGASSVITKSLAPYSLAVGSPAKTIKQGDEYIKKYSHEEKTEILKKIINDFHEFAIFKGFKSEIAENDGLMSLKVERKKILVSLSQNPLDKIYKDKNSSNIILSLTALAYEDLNPLSIEWFDIENKTSNISRSREANELRNFLSRYGIRFEVI